jgi:hypothetical protein
MPTTTITKTSGVIFVLANSNTYPKSYFGEKGTYIPSTDGTTFTINIGQDTYVTTWQDLRVGTSTPPNFNTARVLLNAIFGT